MLLRPMTFALMLFAISAASQAQTCANPIKINVSQGPYYANTNTCISDDNLPFMAQATYATPGRDVVYWVVSSAGNLPVPRMQFTVIPNSNYDPAMFACSQCGPLAACLDAVDSVGKGGAETFMIEKQPHSYYLTVDSIDMPPNEGCQPFSMNAARAK